MAGYGLKKRLTILACSAMLAGAFDGAGAYFPSQTATAGQELEHARDAMQLGHVGEAIASLKSWLATHPKDVNAKVMLADALLAAHQAQQAQAELKGALQLSPGNFAALVELGSFYAQSGQLNQAEPLLARAAREQPHSPVARLEWATVLSKLREYPKAAAALQGVPAPAASGQRIAYERLKASIDLGLGNASAAAADMELALKLAPGDSGLEFATGLAESHAGHWPRAIELLKPVFRATKDLRAGLPLLEAQISDHQDYAATLAALRAASLPSEEDLPLRLDLAQILIRHGLYAEAAKDFERAVALQPRRAEFRYDLALAEFRAGDLGSALKSAQAAKRLQDSASLESLLGEVQEERGDSLDAVHCDQAAVELAPGREEYRLALGLELLRHDSFTGARAVFKQGAELFPRSFRMLVALGLTYYFVQDYPRAIQTLEAATALGDDPSLALEYLGRIQLDQIVKPQAGAVKLLCSYATTHPKNEKIQAYCGALLARAAHDRGEAPPPLAAMRRLRLAARLAPDDPTARCELGKTLDWARHWAEARQELEACVRLDPNSIDGHYLLAGVYRRLGQKELAIKQIQLHDQAVKRMVRANAERDRTLKKFLVSMQSPSSP